MRKLTSLLAASCVSFTSLSQLFGGTTPLMTYAAGDTSPPALNVQFEENGICYTYEGDKGSGGWEVYLTDENAIEVLPMSEKPGAEDTKFNAESFFVVVGTYGGLTQLRYFGENSAEKVVWGSAPEGLDYGDVFIAEGEVSMTRVDSAPNDPTNRMSYYYDLDEGTKLTKVGNCADLMEQRELTVTSKGYDGSSHWSVRFKDKDGNQFYYGLNTFGSTLGVNVVSLEVGDVCTFAFYNGEVVIPLPKTESSDVPGDVNGDGTFGISDVVLLQRWLLAVPDIELDNWKAADLCEDGRLDVFDLCLMKKALIEKIA